MTPQEFGMWAFATLAWVVTVFLAVFAYAAVRDAYREYWMDEQMRLRILSKVDNGEIDIDVRD
jgi:hypothetical protein|tara:strand:- start:3011 stop:3199 length:189 start_codon:yes stop_codon:yes gene_type:complete